MPENEAHECVFVEEQEPSGRLVLPPCVVCGYSAMDALSQLRAARMGWMTATVTRSTFKRHDLYCTVCEGVAVGCTDERAWEFAEQHAHGLNGDAGDQEIQRSE